MKRRIMLLIIFALIAGTVLSSCLSPQMRDVSKFGYLLIELESSVYFEYQTPQWRSRRSNWLYQVRTTYDLNSMKVLLIEFETNVNYSAQVNTWPARRSGWLNSVKNAYSINQLANLMIECETSINFNAQAPGWRTARNQWLSRARLLSYAPPTI